jgi:hypothetical protein
MPPRLKILRFAHVTCGEPSRGDNHPLYEERKEPHYADDTPAVECMGVDGWEALQVVATTYQTYGYAFMKVCRRREMGWEGPVKVLDRPAMASLGADAYDRWDRWLKGYEV